MHDLIARNYNKDDYGQIIIEGINYYTKIGSTLDEINMIPKYSTNLKRSKSTRYTIDNDLSSTKNQQKNPMLIYSTVIEEANNNINKIIDRSQPSCKQPFLTTIHSSIDNKDKNVMTNTINSNDDDDDNNNNNNNNRNVNKNNPIQNYAVSFPTVQASLFS
ncbi:unnamed protein product [Heterobilharzia americana]|nr:unnamed protein product [Heterobilharzia americana]